jgi:hypothetical protein
MPHRLAQSFLQQGKEDAPIDRVEKVFNVELQEESSGIALPITSTPLVPMRRMGMQCGCAASSFVSCCQLVHIKTFGPAAQARRGSHATHGNQDKPATALR